MAQFNDECIKKSKADIVAGPQFSKSNNLFLKIWSEILKMVQIK